MRVKEESERSSLKLNIKETMIMASGPIVSRQIEGETVEAVGSKITGTMKSEDSYFFAGKL